MSRTTPCPACQDGHHERHVGPWNIREGLLGGDSCPCTGNCKPMEMPEWMTAALDPDPADRGTGHVMSPREERP